MSAFTPADETEREQIRTLLDENMCVEAGAGTGKTTVLVARIVNILASGKANVRELAVMTFTEKAAAELASRVRSGLETSLTATDPGSVEHVRIAEALRDLNHAHIETIHAFASGLLRERPVEAGLDPGFEVLDDLPAQLEFEQQYGDWLTAQMAQEPAPEVLVDALNLGLELRNIREAADQLNNHRELLPLAGYDSHDLDVNAVLDRLTQAAADLETVSAHVKDLNDKGYVQTLSLAERLAELIALRGYDAAARRTIVLFDKINRISGDQSKWVAGKCREMKGIVGSIADEIDGARTAMRERATAELVLWLQDFVIGYADHRKQAGKADFNDLLIWARDLLRDKPHVRTYFQSKFKCVLVDEFQDTDPLQAEIVVALCADGEMPRDWRRTSLRPGSLFVVGDPKQSIYRFRRADIAMYDDVKNNMFGGARRIWQNFRSSQPVIGWVNRTFASMFTAQAGIQPEYIALEAHPDFVAEDAVTVIQPSVSGDKITAPLTRAMEASALASLIADALSREQWHVRAGEGTRPATFRDVVVVVPSRTDLAIYEDALSRANVPHRHEGGRSFYKRQEIGELVSVLRAIDDPNDSVACVAALRSPAFGCSDEDLLIYKAAGGSFGDAHPRGDAPGPVGECIGVLRELAALRHKKPLPDVVRAVLDRTRLVEFAMLQPQGDQVAANLLKVIDQSRAYAEATGGGLRGFVRWLKENIDRTASETDASISEETDDVVRIVTIHASKGLEFPIVVFANMSGKRLDMTHVIADHPGKRLHVKLGAREKGFLTPGYTDAEAAEQAHDEAEEVRLLYVAATRAKDRLVVSVPQVPGKGLPDTSLNFRLAVHGGDSGSVTDTSALPAFDGEAPVWHRPPPTATRAEVNAVTAARDAWTHTHDDLVERGRRPLLVRTATSMKAGMERIGSGEDGVRRNRAADFGTAVHAVLERSRLRDDAIDELSRVAAAEHAQQGREAEIAAIARRALTSPVVARALASRRMLLEAPFTAALPRDEAARHGLTEGIAEGRIDMLFIEDDELVIVDFKTDNVSGAEIDRRTEHYRPQALVYAWAAHRATGMPVREVVLLFATPGAERSFPADAAFMAEAETLLATAPEPAELADPIEV